ncbi:hypothetical protein JY651_19735 [Pyxidicoccus parkwayensis]|jgi:hypothetical protein|uniref:Uncharacterized protein n=1 Tax=Pyxidicoccus parkwayensis TaxID=2813578 RepID=A0ABX7P995_9BACT|nr:hypothetical protein [Pyxidicoccus parkwaysis]QSQ27006.1 hypothetical protein JY651_19735 [Pyxidicoccus parkwaysis]
MDLRILGLDPSEVDFEPDTNPGGLREVLPHGGDYLFLAAELLDLVAPEKGARLRHLLEHDLVPGDTAGQVIPGLDVGRIYFLLEDLEDDMQSVADEHWRLRLEHVDTVCKHAPELVYTFTDENGRTVHTLANTVAAVLTVRNVLHDATVRGRKVLLE